MHARRDREKSCSLYTELQVIERYISGEIHFCFIQLKWAANMGPELRIEISF